MKIEQTTQVQYDDVDTDFRMKLPAFFNGSSGPHCTIRNRWG